MSSWSDLLVNAVYSWSAFLAVFCAFITAVFGLSAYIVGGEKSLRENREKVIAEKKVEEANRVADEAKRHIFDLEELQRPRTITLQQRAKFIEVLKFVPKGTVGTYLVQGSDPETSNYAYQIRDMIGAAGFDNGIQCGSRTGPVPKGIYILVRDPKNPSARPLQEAFAAIGIIAGGHVITGKFGEEVQIVVGTKP